MKHRPIEAPARNVSQRVSDMLSPGDDLVIPPPEGESMPVAGRVDRTTKRMIQRVVQAGHTSFDTESDLVRSAVVRFLADYGAQLQVFTSPEIGQLRKYMQRRQDEARDWDYRKLCNVTKDALLKMQKVSLTRAATHYGRCIEQVRDIDPELAHEFETWIKHEAAFTDIRDEVRRSKKRRVEE